MPIPLLGYIHIASYFIPAAVALRRYNRFTTSMRILAVLAFVSCTNIIILFVMARLKANNQPLANIFVLLEFLLVGLIYFHSATSSRLRGFLLGCLFFFPFIWIVNRAFFDVPLQMNTEMALLSRLFLILMSIFIVAQEQRDLSGRMIDKSVFWVATSVILYSSGTFIVFGVGNLLLKTDVSQFVWAWHINWSLIIISNLLYTKALFCRS